MATKKLNGFVTITRGTTCSLVADKDYIRIKVEDEQSRVQIVEIEMTPHDFMMAITSLANRPATVEWRVDKLGKKYENKTVFVPGKPEWRRDDKLRHQLGRAHLEPFEKDGWIGDVDDLFNHRRSTKQDGVSGQTVVFRRWVDMPHE